MNKVKEKEREKLNKFRKNFSWEITKWKKSKNNKKKYKNK